ncbi:hypothetical protein C8J42_103113 [Sphingomonas sp. PP-CE-1A-559]|nr:hypothetical protein C8J42_103113 [Sphingomonas sp. PP-CE-1A-559]
MLPKYGMPGGKGKGAPAHVARKPQTQKGRPSRDGRPFRNALPEGGALST